MELKITMYNKGDTFKIKTDYGYLSCMFGANCWVILHPTTSEMDKIPEYKNLMSESRKIMKIYAKSKNSENVQFFNTRIILTEKKIFSQ